MFSNVIRVSYYIKFCILYNILCVVKSKIGVTNYNYYCVKYFYMLISSKLYRLLYI